jgi:MFS family permease
MSEGRAAAAPAPVAIKARVHYRVTMLVVMMAVGSFSLAQSMVSPILPTVQRALHTNENTVTWVLTSYLLAAAVFTPILGRVGDMIGKDRVFVGVLVIFALGNVVCALAPNIGTMIAGRGIQGIGGAVVPLGFGIVRDEIPPEKLHAAIGMIAVLLGVGGGVGTAIAGPIVNILNYHWLFWIPAIALGIATVTAHFVIPSTGVRSKSQINWPAAALLAGWLVAMLLAFSEAPIWGWASIKVIGLLLASIVLLILWVTVEWTAKVPLIDMQMLRIPVILRVNAVSLLYGAGLFGSFAFLPQLTQAPTSTHFGYGLSITESGLILLPSSIATFFIGMWASPLARRLGAKAVVCIGSTLGIFPYVLLALPVHSVVLLVVVSLFQGAGFGLAYSTLSNIVTAAVPPEQTGVANGINANFRTIGGAIGAAVVASIITAQLQPSGYPEPDGYRNGWLVLAGVAAAAALLSLTIPKVYSRSAPPHIVDPVDPVDPVQPPAPSGGTPSNLDPALDGAA